MRQKVSLFLFLSILSLSLILPLTVSAFWWFGAKKTETVTSKAPITPPAVLSEQDKTNLVSKYKIWNDSFEKKNIYLVVVNQNKFSFTVAEINSLFITNEKTVKNPTITKASLTSSDGNINVTANFHKVVTGRFSIVAKIISVDNKIRLKASSIKLYGFPVPAKWFEGPVNKALDDYFAFMYNDSRYQGFQFITQDNVLQLKPEFKK